MSEQYQPSKLKQEIVDSTTPVINNADNLNIMGNEVRKAATEIGATAPTNADSEQNNNLASSQREDGSK